MKSIKDVDTPMNGHEPKSYAIEVGKVDSPEESKSSKSKTASKNQQEIYIPLLSLHPEESLSLPKELWEMEVYYNIGRAYHQV